MSFNIAYASVLTHTLTHTVPAPHFASSSLDHLTEPHHLFRMRTAIDLRGWEMLLGGFSRARNTVQRLRTGTRAHVFVYPCFTDHLGCSKCWVMHCRKLLCVLFVHYQTGINENRVTHYQAHVIDRECVCVCVCEGVTPWKSCMWQLHCSLSVVINIQPVSNNMQHFCVQSAL